MKLKRDFVSITDLTTKELWQVLKLAKRTKSQASRGRTSSQLFTVRGKDSGHDF